MENSKVVFFNIFFLSLTSCGNKEIKNKSGYANLASN